MNDVEKRLPLTPDTPPSVKSTCKTIPIEDLMQGNNEVLLSHNSEVYRLRSTRNGKLILTK